MVLNNAQISPITKSQTTPSQQHSLPSNHDPGPSPTSPTSGSLSTCVSLASGSYQLKMFPVRSSVTSITSPATATSHTSSLTDVGTHSTPGLTDTAHLLLSLLTPCIVLLHLATKYSSELCLTFTLSRWVQVRPSLEEIKLVFPGPFLFLFSYPL